MNLWALKLLVFMIVPHTSSRLQCDYTPSHLHVRNISSLKYSLSSEVSGLVVAPWDSQYEQFRGVHNQACCQKPLLIVRPRNRKVCQIR